ncbi:uncharacterized protein LOC122650492 [Telopea speciosissima]|uniref:uncharacterized protein LOC122650492 n=1 Tax=Telopea speciosissima TaxID=54955 RepID=UPI001CC382EF|nr:uncharacterized protein LOC122650492 [Telopea speciosissima]
MANREGSSSNKAPLFDGTNYAFWKLQMQTYLRSLSYDVWMSVETGYTLVEGPLTENAQKKAYENDSKAQNALMSGLVDSDLVKVMGCTTAKQIWDKLCSVHEGDAKIKEEKLQTHRPKFECLKMAEDETIEAYMLRVNEAVNAIRGLGEEIKDPVIVKKVLRSLPPRLDLKVFAIEEAKDLDTFSMDELHGSLSAFEMRIDRPKATDKIAAFKVQKKKKIEPKSDEDDTDTDSDAGETNFVRKLKRGKGKYRDDSSEDESDDDTTDELLFMVLSDITEKSDEHPTTGSDNDEEEAEVDLEGELIAALDELKTERKSHKKTTKQLKEAEKKILEMKVQIEEFKKVVDELETQFSLKSGDCCKLEEEVVMLRNKVDISIENIPSSSDPQTDKLDEILSCQRPAHIKFGLGYEGESSKQMVKGKGTIEDPIQLKKERKNPVQPKTTNVKTIWVKKNDVVENSSMVVKIALKAQNKPMPWLLDSDCSRHMTGNKEIFKKYQQYDGGSVRFGNNDGGKIIGKGTVSFGRKVKSHDVLYMTGLRHSLLSISQICDKGHDVIFNTHGCEIRKSSNGKLVAASMRTSGNLYMLTNEMEGSCLFGQQDENWLWHKRLGHINFDNLVKISSKNVVRDMPKINKPVESICSSC